MAEIFSQLASTLRLGGSAQIGIDVGASSIKIVALKGSEQSPKLLGVATEQTPAGLIVDGVITDPPSLLNVLKKALQKCGVPHQGTPATVGLRGVGVVFRRLILPLQSPEEMANQISLEAQHQIESDLTEWIIDYQVLSEPDRQGQVPVMLVGAKRNVVDDYLSVLQQVGVRPSVFDCDIFALANAYENANKRNIQGTTLCLDIGRDTTKFHLLRNGIPVVVRSFQGGGIHLTESVAKDLAIGFDIAEERKISASKNEGSPSECEAVIERYNSELVQEMQQTIDFFVNSNSDEKIDHVDAIALAGGGARTRGLSTAIASHFKTHVEILDPFKKASFTKKIAMSIGEDAHQYAVAYGLALRKTGDKEQ